MICLTEDFVLWIIILKKNKKTYSFLSYYDITFN